MDFKEGDVITYILNQKPGKQIWKILKSKREGYCDLLSIKSHLRVGEIYRNYPSTDLIKTYWALHISYINEQKLKKKLGLNETE